MASLALPGQAKKDRCFRLAICRDRAGDVVALNDFRLHFTLRTFQMLRLIFVLAAVSSFCCSDAGAQTFFKGGLLKREFGTRQNTSQHTTQMSQRHASSVQPQVSNRYRTPYVTSPSGISIGVGSYPYYNYPRPGQFDPYRFDNYVHDPYITGSFKAPDLLKDPYFRERHRYESKYPARRRTPSNPLVRLIW